MSHRALPEHVKELRRLLNDWDLLGIRDISIYDDEYDCLLGPLFAKLVAGASVEEVRAHLAWRVEGHFGLDPDEVDVARLADRVTRWWSNATTADSR